MIRITSILLVIITALHLVTEGARWQMTCIYLCCTVLLLLGLKKSVAHIAFRIIGFLFAILLISTSAIYAIGMPVKTLPAPTGSYQAGITSLLLEDTSRMEALTNPLSDSRVLFLDIWYPAIQTQGSRPETLWSELYKGETDVVSFLTGYMKNIHTHSYRDASPANGPFPVLLFNHGLQMFTAQNTLLMEYLASHGYVLVSIGHTHESLRINLDSGESILPSFLTSFEEFNKAMAWITESSRPIQQAMDSIRTQTDPIRKGQIMQRAIQSSPLNETVTSWARDNGFVLDWLVNGQTTSIQLDHIIDTARIGVMGMSIGGATAFEVARQDTRIKAGVNIDGLGYGSADMSLTTPFLMVYSDDGAGQNDFVKHTSRSDFHEYHLEGSRHSDLTDMVQAWPILKLYGQSGVIPPERILELQNSIVINFLDHYLKNKPLKSFPRIDFPELHVDIRRTE